MDNVHLEHIEELTHNCYSSGQLAEGRCYKEIRVMTELHHEIPVASNGAGLMMVLLQLSRRGCNKVFIQSNTMRALMTVPLSVGYEVKVIQSAREFCLGMDPNDLEMNLKYHSVHGNLNKIAVIISPLGGYIHQSHLDCMKLANKYGATVIVDAAHCHFLLEDTWPYDYSIYSFYATKPIPLGEGGLITCSSFRDAEDIRRMLEYDKHNFVYNLGINVRMSELNCRILEYMCNNTKFRQHFITVRKHIVEKYAEFCRSNYIPHIGPGSTGILKYNGYKFFVLTTKIFTEKYNTSTTFDKLVDGSDLPRDMQHQCPATYNSLIDIEINEICQMLMQLK
jgi:dTDP-4-amino-4,6-dideoxygalactose transaminase